MDWIKKHYDQFTLGVFALALLAFSGIILFKSIGFPETFSSIQATPPRNDRIAALEKGPVEEATQSLEKPTSWNPSAQGGSLFVGHKYTIDPKSGQPIRPGGAGSINGIIPDVWLLKYDLDVLSSTVLQDDPDGDGFSNLDEYLGADRSPVNGDADSTNPKDKASHPPYHTKLFLKQYIKVAFLLKFNAFDGDPKKPESMTFQINARDLRAATAFVQLGAIVPGTKFKIEKFEPKTQINKKTDAEEDVSEVTLLNTETGKHEVLILDKVTDSLESYALFIYLWPQPAIPIRVKMLQEFALVPNAQERYKLIDIKEAEAQIALPSGEKYTVPSLPK